MIFKLQKPMSTNMEVPMALVYNEDRSTEAYIPYNLCKKLFSQHNKLKIYVDAEIKNGNLVVNNIVEDQNW